MKKNSKKTTTETTKPAAQAAPVAQPRSMASYLDAIEDMRMQHGVHGIPPDAPAAEQQQPKEPKQEQKPDFYARLLKDRPTEAASIMATLNRRKDFALRQLAAHLKAGRNAQEAMHHAMAIAFPTHKEAHA